MKMTALFICILVGLACLQGESSATTMIEIPGGNFVSGDVSGAGGNNPAEKVDSFFIDEFETTNAEFVKVFPDHNYPQGAEEHPASHMTWAQAKAFCESQGKRLPSALEWERSARGREERIYPWSNKALKKKPHPFYSGLVKRRVGFNKKDVSPYGVRNMASSVWEWTADVQDGKAIVRGGLWNLHLDYEYSKTFDDIRLPPEKGFIFLGFRCARSL
jgi:formylglycine-generating enzyme required for sulfatase activity